jgi:uncharacterized membrane protein
VLGKVLYPQGKRAFDLPDISDNWVMEKLSFIGKHSLPIYLLQLPFYFLGVSQLPEV